MLPPGAANRRAPSPGADTIAIDATADVSTRTFLFPAATSRISGPVDA